MAELKSYHTDHGIKTVLVCEKRKYLRVLIMDGSLVVKKLPKSEQRYMRDVIESKKRRTLPIRDFASYGHRRGATKAAKQFLREARHEAEA